MTAVGAVRFGPWEFDPETGELRRDGEPADLQPQPARLLAELLRHPGRVVRREHLYEVLWPERIVEYDQGLNFAVARLRKALDDDASDPRWVETVPHVGYRFVGEVRPADADERTRSAGPRGRPGPGLLAAVALAATVVAVSAGVIGVRSPEDEGAPESSEPERPRLAVLPFEWIGGAPDSALLRGIFDDLVTEMATLDPERLAVVGPESARRAGALGGERAAALLEADWLVSGSVHVDDAGELRIHGRLTETVSRTVVWSDRFVRAGGSRGSIGAAVADGVARELSKRVGLRVGARRARFPVDAATRRGLRTARHLLDRGDSVGHRLAGDTLRALARRGGGSVALHAALAEWHARRERWDSARTHGARAVGLDDRDPRGHRQLARALLALWDVEGAGRHYRRAVDLAPGVSLYRAILPAYLGAVGGFEEAVHHLERAVELDPLAPGRYRDLAETLVLYGAPERAVPLCRRRAVLAPDDDGTSWCLYRAFSVAGRLDSAAVYALGVMTERGASGTELRDARRTDRPEDVLAAYRSWNADRLARLHRKGREEPYFVARAQAAAGRVDAAFRHLDEAVVPGSMWPLYADAEPWFDPLRDDPRFQRFLDRVAAAVGEARTRSGRALSFP